MSDSTVKKVEGTHAPAGAMGQRYLASGKRVSMRLWSGVPAANSKPEHENDYETVGYAISGQAVLEIADQSVTLSPGDSWLVPAGARHRYRIIDSFTAVEATAPPAQVHGRDE